MLTLEEAKCLAFGAALEFSLGKIKYPCTFVCVDSDDTILVVFEEAKAPVSAWTMSQETSEYRDFGTRFNLTPNLPARWVAAHNLSLMKIPEVTVTPPKSDGEFCLDCKDFFPMARSNHSEGLVCYSCRSTYPWKWNIKS